MLMRIIFLTLHNAYDYFYKILILIKSKIVDVFSSKKV